MSMDVFKSLDKLLEVEATKIKYDICGTNKYDGELFNPSKKIKIDSSMNIVEDKGECGIYIFVMRKSCTVDIIDFNDINHATRIKKNGNQLNEEDVLYLGKSEKNLKKRIEQHINDEDSTTYSLKLAHHKRNFLYGKLELKYFILRDEYVEYKELILARVESHLHKKLNPKVGSRKTS